jgi:indolepyruvate ferredoxin oxidoreductase beta subunit
MLRTVTNIVVAGLGGQGVLSASDILADAILRSGFEVKKSEIKGMSQRGGSVTSDVRFGSTVLSPMVTAGEADYLLVLESTQIEPNQFWLRPGGVLLSPALVDPAKLPNRKTLNVALLGALSTYLPIQEKHWLTALQSTFPAQFFAANREAFFLGRQPAAIPCSSS